MANISLSSIKKEHLVLLSIILIIAIFFGAYRNVLKPLLGRIKKGSAQIEQKRKDFQRARVGPESLKTLEAEITEIKNQADYYQQRLERSIEVPQILKELNQIAERLRVKIISVNPLQQKETLLPGEEEILLEAPIRIKLQCGYHQLGIFINHIENSARFMKITALKINADRQSLWTHQAELVVTSYGLISNQGS